MLITIRVNRTKGSQYHKLQFAYGFWTILLANSSTCAQRRSKYPQYTAENVWSLLQSSITAKNLSWY